MATSVWNPSSERINNSHMHHFLNKMVSKFNIESSYKSLHRWSVDSPGEFWSELIDFFGVEYRGDLEPACGNLNFDKYSWFENVELNFAKNLLSKAKGNNSIAINFVHESGLQKKTTYDELYKKVGKFSNSLKEIMNTGDVLACFMPNISETIVSMLASSSFGGIFTSTSCDFGVEGVLDRFSQSRPKVLVCVAGYEYNGKYFDLTDKIIEINNKLDCLEKIIIVDFLNKSPDISKIENAVLWDEFLNEDSTLSFTDIKFNHPQYIMYSSGTTGKPKCIVHCAGGVLLQHIKELGLHSDLKPEKKIFYFTTCGWMMWNWLVSSLYFGSEIVLYEGSPGYPGLLDFFKIVEKEKVNIFGTSPKFLKALEDTKVEINVNLDSLETILSTGAPLLPEQFDFVYNKIKKDVQLSSICGGTDIIGCFMLGNPILPVNRGEIQCLGLGMDVACFNEQGKDVIGEEGELVCKKSFPSRPIYFLNDESNERINSAYFNKYKNIWHHGDFVTITRDGGVNVFGRSDATLNPGGVRIGTSEIYRQTETLSYLGDSICVGKQVDGDVEVILYVKLTENEILTEDRIKEIKKNIRKNTTPRHVPSQIIAVNDIPYTRSGKKMEMIVTRLINGKKIDNTQAVSNPESLREFKP